MTRISECPLSMKLSLSLRRTPESVSKVLSHEHNPLSSSDFRAILMKGRLLSANGHSRKAVKLLTGMVDDLLSDLTANDQKDILRNHTHVHLTYFIVNTCIHATGREYHYTCGIVFFHKDKITDSLKHYQLA